jgi:two-component system sensor histidine kinase KdpD
VETHGRQETLALLDKLAILPRTLHLHRQQRLEEMDLDGLLARKPAIAVVDELAHSNAPGSRHEKRWQDVEELLGPASTSTPPSTCSTWRASTIWCGN